MSRQYPCVVVHRVDTALFAASMFLSEERCSVFTSGPYQDGIFQEACEFATYLIIPVYDEVWQ